MAQTLVQMYTHLIFSTKDRRPLLEEAIHEPLIAYLGGALRKLQSPLLAGGCATDHIHLLYSHSKNVTLIALLEQIKKESSKWIKTQGAQFERFYWQRGYGAFSVSASKLDVVDRYVRNQMEHHRKVTFQEEFRRFLKEYGIAYDERYVWD